MNHRLNRVVGFGRLAVILCWAGFLGFAWVTTRYPKLLGGPGRLEIINPSYRWLSLAAAGALFLVAAALLLARGGGHSHHPDGGCEAEEGNREHEEAALSGSCCDEEASAGELAFHALFLAPIVLCLCAGGRGLSPASIARRGIHEVPLTRPGEARSAASGGPALAQRPLSMSDLYDCVLLGAPAGLAGRPVSLTGQYCVDERCGENQFLVTRIVVTCCLADAEVIGLRAQSSRPLKPGASWVSVTGTLKVLNDRFSNPALFVADATVSAIPPPVSALLYPRPRSVQW